MTHDLVQVVRSLGSPNILVVGDIMLDRYLYCTVDRIAQEAPTPVLREGPATTQLGGAGAVAAMASGLGADVRLVGFVGPDPEADDIHLIFSGHTNDAIQVDPHRCTTVKTRFLAKTPADQYQQVFRLDRESTEPIDRKLEDRIVAELPDLVRWADVVLVSDYGKGVCTDRVLRSLAQECRRHPRLLLVDPAPSDDYHRYSGADLLTPNRREAEAAVGYKIDSDIRGCDAAVSICRRFGIPNAIVTMDRDGMAGGLPDDRRWFVPASNAKVVDTTGAGDMVLAALGLAATKAHDWFTCGQLANLAAGLEVERHGSAVLSRHHLLQALGEPDDARLLSWREALVAVRDARRAGKSIGFTNGCFDVLHPGHVHLLREAKRRCGFLVVGLNSFESVRRLKGPGRPRNFTTTRANQLHNVGVADAIVEFEDDTPLDLIELLKPDVLIKGQDYQEHEIAGAAEVKRWGGEVVLVPLVPGFSSTRLIEGATV